MVFFISLFIMVGAMEQIGLFEKLARIGLNITGGNGTAIGASANVVVIGIAEKRGIHISFIDFLKVAFPLMILSIVISTGYLLGWYYIVIMR